MIDVTASPMINMRKKESDKLDKATHMYFLLRNILGKEELVSKLNSVFASRLYRKREVLKWLINSHYGLARNEMVILPARQGPKDTRDIFKTV